VDVYRSRFDHRAAADLVSEAEHFERMAERFKDNDELSEGFRRLAAVARARAADALR